MEGTYFPNSDSKIPGAKIHTENWNHSELHLKDRKFIVLPHKVQCCSSVSGLQRDSRTTSSSQLSRERSPPKKAVPRAYIGRSIDENLTWKNKRLERLKGVERELGTDGIGSTKNDP